MQEIKLNNYTDKLYIIYNNIKIKGISTISGLNVSANYELIKQFNRDGFILEDLNLLNELKVEVTFYTKEVKKLGEIFKHCELTDIYFNNTEYSYKGFMESFTIEKFKNDMKEVVMHFVLQPFCCKNKESIEILKSGAIENKGHVRIYPKIKIKPTNKDFYIAINGIKMEFKVSELKTYVADLDNIEIYDEAGELSNSIFKGGKIPFLKVGVNSILLNNCTTEFIVNWRYIFYDLFTGR